MLGKVFDDRYRIDAVIGRGGMGTVYSATQLAMSSTVAVKVMLPEYARKKEAATRFHREAKAASMLKHPHCIRVFDFGQTLEGDLFMVMEHLDGRPLSALIDNQGPQPLERVVKVVSQIAQALIEAHERDLIHRDLKAENVFLCKVSGDPDFVKVLDFGIAKFATGSDSSDVTRTGTVMGTPAYMSPEQSGGRRGLTTGSDIYSLGVILYEMLTGRVPFTGESALDVLMSHVHDPPPPISPEINRPAELDSLLSRMLEKLPEDRPDAVEVQQVLEDIHLTERLRTRDARPTTPPRERDAAPPSAPRSSAPAPKDNEPPRPRVTTDPSDDWGFDATSAVPGPLTLEVQETINAGAEPDDRLRRSRRVGAWVALALLAVALMIVGALWQRRATNGDGPRPEAADHAPDQTSLVTPSRVVEAAPADVTPPPQDTAPMAVAVTPLSDVGEQSPTPIDASVEADAPSVSDAVTGEGEAAPEISGAPRAVTVQFESTPGGAVVLWGDERLCETPCQYAFPPEQAEQEVRFKLARHRDRLMRFEVVPGATVSARMKRRPSKDVRKKTEPASSSKPKPKPKTVAKPPDPSKVEGKPDEAGKSYETIW